MARFLIDSPPFVPAPYGLFDVATLPDDSDPHIWQQEGVEWDSRCYGPAGIEADAGCPPVEPGEAAPAAVAFDKIAGDGDEQSGRPTFGFARPFVVWTVYECALVGRSMDDHRRLAAEALARSDTRTIEAVVERGAPTPDGSLAGAGWPLDASLASSATPLAGGPLSVVEAIGRLETEFSWMTGGQPTLHLPRHVASAGLAEGVLTITSGRLRTALGSPVAAGAGYLGAGAGGRVDGEATIYATGPVVAYRSRPEVVGETKDGIDREVNDIGLIVERQVMVGWDCGALSIAVAPGAVAGAGAGGDVVYTWDGDSYEVTGGRTFIGPVDPATEGFVLDDGDQWENTAP